MKVDRPNEVVHTRSPHGATAKRADRNDAPVRSLDVADAQHKLLFRTVAVLEPAGTAPRRCSGLGQAARKRRSRDDDND